jgi:hypothetical protein
MKTRMRASFPRVLMKIFRTGKVSQPIRSIGNSWTARSRGMKDILLCLLPKRL